MNSGNLSGHLDVWCHSRGSSPFKRIADTERGTKPSSFEGEGGTAGGVTWRVL